MNIFSTIQTALDTKLNTISGNPSIAWPNTDFKPVENTLFLSPTLLPISNTLSTIGGVGLFQGIYQIDIYVPLEKGSNTINTWVDRIYNLYSEDRTLYEAGGQVFIQNIDRGPVERDRSWYKTNVDINFIVYK